MEMAYSASASYHINKNIHKRMTGKEWTTVNIMHKENIPKLPLKGQY
jgi:hypothetical protein